CPRRNVWTARNEPEISALSSNPGGKLSNMRWTMPVKPTYTIVALSFAAAVLLTTPATTYGQDAPEGIRVTVVAEYESRVPSLEKVRLVRVLVEPGASFDNVEIKNEEYCELKAGTLTHTNHTSGGTNVYTVGAHWAPPKGDRHTVTNNGDVVADMWVYQLIERGQDADNM
ncbi:MAG: hypothetical protein WD645_03085, partial [Dehalococcoidia bacterium]